MSIRNKILLKGLRTRLTPKEVALFKLVVWCVLIVWMVFFLAYAIITARIMAQQIPLIFPQTTFYQALAKMLPYWFVFTIGLTELIIARWAYRKLRKQNGEIIKGQGR